MYYLTQQKAQRQRVSCVPGPWVCCPAISHAPPWPSSLTITAVPGIISKDLDKEKG